jgi:hypothetical protein
MCLPYCQRPYFTSYKTTGKIRVLEILRETMKYMVRIAGFPGAKLLPKYSEHTAGLLSDKPYNRL